MEIKNNFRTSSASKFSAPRLKNDTPRDPVFKVLLNFVANQATVQLYDVRFQSCISKNDL